MDFFKSSRNKSHIVWQVCDAARLLIWRLSVCTLSFDGLKPHLLKKCFSDLILYEAVKPSGLTVQLNIKFFLMKPTHEYITKAKEVYIQVYFERYKGS